MSNYPTLTVIQISDHYLTMSRFFSIEQVSHAMELAATGAELVVLPQAFMVHMPHAPSHDIVRFRSSKRYRE